MTTLALATLLVILATSATAQSADDPLSEAKRAYEAAAYEDALRLLAPLDSPHARQYVALCLLALGRTDEAARAVEAMVKAEPLFSPSPADVPPRFAKIVTETRLKVLPVAARKAFADGRERFNAKQMSAAMPHFELALRIAEDPLWRATPDAQDVRTLAGEFARLAREAAAPVAAAPPPAAAQPARPAVRPAAISSGSAASASASQPRSTRASPGGLVTPPAAASMAASIVAPLADNGVTQTLYQYARAYGLLDAGAARAVWPSVDERALARAFAGLESQSLLFDSCDIDVRGATATASCRGLASYVGKVGSRELRTEARQWRFTLRLDGEAWKIESAETRRLSPD